jgi:hypothetical protein
VEQHPDRALGALQDAGDLGGAQVVHEAQHDGTSPVARQPPHRRPRRRSLGPGDGRALDVVRGGHVDGGLERRGRSTPQGAAMVRNDVPGDPEEPDAEGRGFRARILGRSVVEAWQPAEGEHERAFRHVLRLVMITELVIGKVVDLGEVFPVERVELQRVGLGRTHQRPVRVERHHLPGAAERSAFPHSS